MAWTTPRTWLAGELVKEGDLNAQIRDNELILKTALNDSGKIIAISATYFADLSGANLTGVVKTASANTYTAGVNSFNGGSTVRVILPVGADKWAT
jgi:hypothetical protein